MEDTEPMVYLAYLVYAVLFTMIAIMLVQGAVDSSMTFSNMEATGLNVAMAKNFHLLNQGERFGKFTSQEIENLKADKCKINLPGYIDDKPKHKVDDSCNYYKESNIEKKSEEYAKMYEDQYDTNAPKDVQVPRLRTYAIVTDSNNNPRIITTIIPLKVLDSSRGGGGE